MAPPARDTGRRPGPDGPAAGDAPASGDGPAAARTVPAWDESAGPAPGGGLVRLNTAGTALFTVSATTATFGPDAVRIVGVVVALGLFAAGCVAFVLAYALAVRRSVRDEIGIGGLFFLAGDTAPASRRRPMMALLAVQVVVSLVSASIRPFSSLAFGTLVPVFGLGLAGLWSARHGRFGPRVAPSAAARVEQVARTARAGRPPVRQNARPGTAREVRKPDGRSGDAADHG